MLLSVGFHTTEVTTYVGGTTVVIALTIQATISN